MSNTVSYKVNIYELPDGNWQADCPDLLIAAKGENKDSAVTNITNFIETTAKANRTKDLFKSRTLEVRNIEIEIPDVEIDP